MKRTKASHRLAAAAILPSAVLFRKKRMIWQGPFNARDHFPSVFYGQSISAIPQQGCHGTPFRHPGNEQSIRGFAHLAGLDPLPGEAAFYGWGCKSLMALYLVRSALAIDFPGFPG
jgi:hypothetical protein